MGKEYVNFQTGEKLDLNRVNQLPDNAMLKVKPELWCEWDFEKNVELGFDIWKITKGSAKKTYWNCFKCKSSCFAIVAEKVRKKCGYCSGIKVNDTNSLSSLNPKLASEWHSTKNGNLTPHDVTCGSNKKVWWMGECGHEWIAVISSRNTGRGCPYCSGKKVDHKNSLASLNPQLASE